MIGSLRTIVVGVGRADAPEPHLRSALTLAEAQGAEVYVVHAYHLPDPLIHPYPEIGSFDPQVLEAAQQAVQRRLEDQVAALVASRGVSCRTVAMPADAALLQTAEEVEADLIVVGATTHGSISRSVLGTTAGRVLRSSPVPVLVGRRQRSGALRRVLLTTDLSELSGRVHRRAIALLEPLGAEAPTELRALLVVGDDLATTGPERPAVLKRIADAELRPFLQRLDPEVFTLSEKVRLGDAAAEILAEAEEWDADLLVLGTHGRGGISRFLIGSVAESVVKRAPCDVLVIPAAAVAMGNGTETSD